MNQPAPNDSETPSRWQDIVPARKWLKRYKRGWFRADLAAGFTLAAYLLPSALGQASLAGLPPQAGLYSCLFGGLVFWIFCSSRQTAVTVTSAISLLIGSSLGGFANGDPALFATMAACTALLTALIAFLAWLARAGSAVSFISESVLVGFKAGVALHLASTQLPKLCGFNGGHGDFWQRMHDFFGHLNQTNPVALAIGLAALAALILGKKLFPNKPVALVVLIGSIAAASFVNLSVLHVQLLGDVPRGIPLPLLPTISLNDTRDLIPLALACFLLGAVETAAIGRMFSEKYGYRLNSNQDLLALAAANLAAGLGQGYPIGGGMSQSVVNESGGARTPLSGLISAGIILVIALFFTTLLHNLPQPVLAAIVLMAVAGLVHVSELRRLWTTHRDEFLVAATALVGVLGAGLLQGVLVGAIISLVLLLRRTSSPHVAFLGRIPGTHRYSDLSRHADNEPTPGILAFRVESSLVYFNAEHVYNTVLAKLKSLPAPVNLVICDLSTSPSLDMAGARMLLKIHAKLERRGIPFRVVEARSSVRDLLRVEGMEAKIGHINRFTTLAEAIENHQNTLHPPAAADTNPEQNHSPGDGIQDTQRE